MEKVLKNLDSAIKLATVCSILEPAKIATENLSKSDSNLLEGEATLKFLINEIEEQKHLTGGFLSNKFSETLLQRLESRRHKLLNSLILYLKNSDALKQPYPLTLATVLTRK